MIGAIYSMLAGIFICLQGVFNTRASEKIGLCTTNAIVHGLGFFISIIVLFISKDNYFGKITDVNKLYLIGGAMGVVIIYSVMKGISYLGATYATAILLVTQLVIALIIDTFGLFGATKVALDFTKPIGVGIMIIGIVIFKIRG